MDDSATAFSVLYYNIALGGRLFLIRYSLLVTNVRQTNKQINIYLSGFMDAHFNNFKD